MEALFFLIPLSLLLVFGAIYMLVWSVRDGQYDDLDKEAWRILQNEDNDSDGRGTS